MKYLLDQRNQKSFSGYIVCLVRQIADMEFILATIIINVSQIVYKIPETFGNPQSDYDFETTSPKEQDKINLITSKSNVT